jgi:hypothetical protein
MLGCKLKPELVAMESRSGKEEKGNSIEVGAEQVVGGGRVIGVAIDNLILRDSIN